MNIKTIKVDLSLFFDDERKMSCILVDPSWKTVECLQKRVEHLFDIRSVLFLSDGCYLPSKEPIDIIRYCDVVKAFVLKETQDVRKRKKSKKSKEILEKSENNTEKIANDELVTSTRDLNGTSSISLKTNKMLAGGNKQQESFSSKNESNPSKKRKTVCDETSIRFSELACSTLLNNSNILKECSNDQQLSSSKTPDNDANMSARHRTKNLLSTTLNEKNLPEECNKNQKLSGSKNPNNPFKKYKSSKAHIYFDETGDILSPKSKKEKNSLPKDKNKKSGTIIVFRCPLNDVANGDGAEAQKPRIFHLKSKCATGKQLIEIQKDILLPSLSLSTSSNEATIINNVEKETTKATDAFNHHLNHSSINSTTAQIENEKQGSSLNLSKPKNEETNINKEERELQIVDDDIEAQNERKTEFSCVDEPVSDVRKTGFSCVDEPDSESQDESQLITPCAHDNNSSIQNKSEVNRTSADVRYTDSQMELTHVADQAFKVKDTPGADQSSVNENSIMSIDCVDLDDEVPLRDDTTEQYNFTADDECDELAASDVEEVSQIIELNESEYNCSTTHNNSNQQHIPFEDIEINKILPLSSDIKDLPSTDNIIIFKIPYNTNKTHTCTNFVAGKVEYVNKRTKNIKVSILDGISELCHVPKKFVCNLDDSDESAKRHLQLKLTDMIEPKLFSMP